MARLKGNTMSNILIPLDATNDSLDALDLVVRLAESGLANNANVTLLHIKEKDDNTDGHLLSNLHNSRLKLEHAGFTTNISVGYGHPAQEIERFAKQLDVDLIVMVTHNLGGSGQFLHGSVAEYLLNHVDIPLTLIKAQEPETNDNILKYKDYVYAFQERSA